MELSNPRWFNVTFLSPSWRSLSLSKRSLHHPKKVTSRIARSSSLVFSTCGQQNENIIAPSQPNFEGYLHFLHGSRLQKEATYIIWFMEAHRSTKILKEAAVKRGERNPFRGWTDCVVWLLLRWMVRGCFVHHVNSRREALGPWGTGYLNILVHSWSQRNLVTKTWLMFVLAWQAKVNV